MVFLSACTPTNDRLALDAAADHPIAEPAPPPESAAETAAGSAWTLPSPDAPGDVTASGILTIVNKANQLVPTTYRPSSLARVSEHEVAEVAAEPLRELLAAARAAGLQLRTRSGFRSYESQAQVHAKVVASSGQARADKQVLRPGYSEHQTGLAVDLLPTYGHACDDFACFGETPHAAWLAEHSWQFGWIVRYEPGMEHVTGITWEPWHVRYIGRDAAAAYHASRATSLEKFLGLPAAPHYHD